MEFKRRITHPKPRAVFTGSPFFYARSVKVRSLGKNQKSKSYFAIVRGTVIGGKQLLLAAWNGREISLVPLFDANLIRWSMLLC